MNHAIPALILAVGVALSGLAFWAAGTADDQRARSVLELRVEWRARDLEDKINDAALPTEALADFIPSQSALDPTEFHQFAVHARRDDPVSRLVWAPLVRKDQRTQFEAEARQAGLTDYVIGEMAPNGALRPAADRDEYLPTRLVETFDGSAPNLGFDLRSDKIRAAIAEDARDRGEPVAAPPLQSFGNPNATPNYIIFWPVYSTAVPPTTLAERHAAFTGMVIGVYPVDAMMKFAIQNTRDILGTLNLFIDHREGQPYGTPMAIYRPETGQIELPTQPLPAPPSGSLRLMRTFTLFGHEWTLVTDYSADVVSGLRSSTQWGYLALGLLMTFGIVAYMMGEQRRRLAVEIEVAERTRDLRETSEQLRGTTEQMKAIVDASPVAIAVFDSARNVMRWNRAAERMSGYSADELIGHPIPEALGGGTEEVRQKFDTIIRGEVLDGLEARRRRKDGEFIDVITAVAGYFDVDGAMLGLVSATLDVTRWKNAEVALRDSEEKYRATFELVPVGIIHVTPVGHFLMANKFYCSMLGYEREELLSMSVMDVTDPEDLEQTRGGFQRSQAGDSSPGTIVKRYITKDGRLVWCEVSFLPQVDAAGRPSHNIAVVNDITARKLAEEQQVRLTAQLQQAQKMEAIGQLTGGLAHDFNNLLGVVLGNLDFLQENQEPGTDDRALTDAAIHAALRGAELTRQLLAFARQQPLAPKLTNLNAVLEGSTQLLRRTLGEHITLELRISETLWPVLIDPSQLESAILNLAVNARDVMEDGGKLTVEARNVTLDEGAAELNPEAAPGDYVAIAVSDTGTGMPPEVMAKVFEPFFSTKGSKGTGLGLSMVHGFVKQSGGHTKIYSEPGRGTTIRMYLPRTERDAVEAETGSNSPSLTHGNEVILVVEDNKGLRDIALRQLQQFGYRTIPAADGAQALEIVKGGAPIDLLFTDVVMPGGMDGRALAEAVRRLQPNLKVLFTSGFTAAAASAAMTDEFGFNLLSKPYRKEELGRRIRAVLDGPNGQNR